MPPKLNKKPRIRRGKGIVPKGPHRLFVRPWDGVPSMVDGFAMLRGIENKYGKIKAFKFIRDGEVPSTYFSYFWVELEDRSKSVEAASTVLQVPIPEVERKRPGGIGIADLQPFLRPSHGSEEDSQEWRGVTERMADEVDEQKWGNRIYDIRLEHSGIRTTRDPPLTVQKHFILTKAFVKWGGFSSSSNEGSAGLSTTPMLDHVLERGSHLVKTDNPATTAAGDQVLSPPPGEPHKPFNHNFDEPIRPAETQIFATSHAEKVSSAQPQSLLTMQREGKLLSRKQKALLQAAAISRTPLPKAPAEANEEQDSMEAEAASEPRIETGEERKQFQDKVWNLVKGKWF